MEKPSPMEKIKSQTNKTTSWLDVFCGEVGMVAVVIWMELIIIGE